MKNNIVTHGRRAWILSVLLGLILGGVIAWTAWNSQILPVVFGVLIGGGALLIIGGLVYFIFAAVAERGVRKWKQLQQEVSHLQDTAKFILRKAQELNLLPALLQMMVDRQQPIKECDLLLWLNNLKSTVLSANNGRQEDHTFLNILGPGIN